MVLAALPHGNGRVLSEGRSAAPRDTEPDLHRDDAVHGDPGARDLFALQVSTNRFVGAVLVVLIIPASAPGFQRPARRVNCLIHENLQQEEKDAAFFVSDRRHRW